VNRPSQTPAAAAQLSPAQQSPSSRHVAVQERPVLKTQIRAPLGLTRQLQLSAHEPGQASAQAPATQTSPSGQVPQEATPHLASRPPGPHASTAQAGAQHSPR
jgi:hypothetical protein